MRLTEPIDGAGQPMITVRQAAQTIGRERPWITRQLHAGALRGGKIGNDRDWALDYRHTRSTTHPARPRATEQRHRSPTDAALTHRAPSKTASNGYYRRSTGSPRKEHSEQQLRPGGLTCHRHPVMMVT